MGPSQRTARHKRRCGISRPRTRTVAPALRESHIPMHTPKTQRATSNECSAVQTWFALETRRGVAHRRSQASPRPRHRYGVIVCTRLYAPGCRSVGCGLPLWAAHSPLDSCALEKQWAIDEWWTGPLSRLCGTQRTQRGGKKVESECITSHLSSRPARQSEPFTLRPGPGTGEGQRGTTADVPHGHGLG